MLRIPIPAVLGALCLLLLSGCVSTEKRFEKAGELEGQARWLEAADQYAEVLERERDYPGAADRLADVGARAVAQLMDDVRMLDQSRNPAEAVERLDRLRALVERARGVGVLLVLPAGIDRMRDRLVAAAMTQLMDQGRAAMARRDFRAAVDAYDRLLERYRPTGQARRDAVFARAAALLAWARADMEDNRFRSAFDRLGQAVASLDSTQSPEEQEVRETMAIALARGVRRLAIIPFWHTDGWMRAAPTRLRDDINESLTGHRTATPSPFIALVDPAEVRRFTRVNRLDAMILDRERMADIGRQVSAAFVATGEAVRFTRTERVRQEEQVRARFAGRAGRDTTYTRRDLEVRFTARVEYRVVDVSTGRVRTERSVEADVTDRFTRSVFARDYRDLDLSDRERREFDPAEWARQDDELGLDLADRLSAELAERVYSDVLSFID